MFYPAGVLLVSFLTILLLLTFTIPQFVVLFSDNHF